ncbi:MAG: T9SS type A sorting domain-containing protein, partial [Flavobacteriales bacterium]|nr:T9SS type A sorting domain-containing protein [Flavobacteriales bacterium]
KEGTELLSEIKTVDFPENKISLTLLPNPASTEVMVVINDNQENVFSIKIRDLSGRVVKEAAVANETKIDVSDLRKGVYQIELYKQETLQQYQKLVKS